MRFSRHQTVTAALCLAAIWLLTHRYHGIHHDALFYAVQALAQGDPARFEHDLFFVFGSQNDYTLFTPPYAWLSRQIGLGTAAFALLAVAQCIWAFAAFRIARQWLHGTFLVAGLALLFALPAHYGYESVFHYAESFLTARIWAESLVLLGLAATLKGRGGLAVAAILGACLLHPIMALPGVMFLAAYHWQRHWKWLPLLLMLALAVAGALPKMDAAWIELVQKRAPFVFIERWRWQEWVEPFTWIGILLAAARGIAPARNAFFALALTGAAGLGLAVIATLTQAALFVQAQPWRSLWLLKVCGLLALVALFMERWRRSAADRWLLAGFAAAALTAGSLGGATAMVLALLANSLWRREVPPVLPRWVAPGAVLALFAVLLETLLALLQQGSYLLERIQGALSPGTHWPVGDLASVFYGPLALLLAPLAVILVLVAGRRPAAGIGAALIFLAAASFGWYRADDLLQNHLFRTTQARPFDREIPPDATVYWQDNFLYAWFLLGQGNYASIQQSVGVVFSRQTAQETRRRLARIAAFSQTDSDIGPDGRLRPANELRSQPSPQAADLAALCQDPILHSVILRQALGAPGHPTWADPLGNGTWYLHRCEDFRFRPAAENPPPPSPPPPSRSAPPHRLRSVPVTAPA
jgi:hypothetical protein